MSSMAAAAKATTHTYAGRALLLLSGLAALAGAIVLLGPWALALWLIPDLALLPGLRGAAARDGRLAPGAVPVYNAVHMFAGPLALTLIGALAGPVVLGLGLVWLSHVTIDRAAGYGLRDRDGSVRG
jgi:Domain of unknown function (DUF4260)